MSKQLKQNEISSSISSEIIHSGAVPASGARLLVAEKKGAMPDMIEGAFDELEKEHEGIRQRVDAYLKLSNGLRATQEQQLPYEPYDAWTINFCDAMADKCLALAIVDGQDNAEKLKETLVQALKKIQVAEKYPGRKIAYMSFVKSLIVRLSKKLPEMRNAAREVLPRDENQFGISYVEEFFEDFESAIEGYGNIMNGVKAALTLVIADGVRAQATYPTSDVVKNESKDSPSVEDGDLEIDESEDEEDDGMGYLNNSASESEEESAESFDDDTPEDPIYLLNRIIELRHCLRHVLETKSFFEKDDAKTINTKIERWERFESLYIKCLSQLEVLKDFSNVSEYASSLKKMSQRFYAKLKEQNYPADQLRGIEAHMEQADRFFHTAQKCISQPKQAEAKAVDYPQGHNQSEEVSMMASVAGVRRPSGLGSPSAQFRLVRGSGEEMASIVTSLESETDKTAVVEFRQQAISPGGGNN